MESIREITASRALASGAALGAAAAALGALAALALGPAAAVASVPLAALGAALAARRLLAPRRAADPTEAAPHASAIPEDRVDALTGLANANGLAAWFAEKSRALDAGRMAIVVFSAGLEGVDAIAASRGRETADRVLVEVARRVAAMSGSDGIAARTGGGEFAAVASVVPANAVQAAMDRAGKLAEVLCRPVELPGGAVWIAGSVGAAAGSPLEAEDTHRRARAALDQARRLGQGRFTVDQ